MMKNKVQYGKESFTDDRHQTKSFLKRFCMFGFFGLVGEWVGRSDGGCIG